MLKDSGSKDFYHPFQYLLENTTAGYVLYGAKPLFVAQLIDPTLFPEGTERQQFALQMHRCFQEKKIPISKNPNISLSFYIDSNNKTPELLLINKSLFIETVTRHLDLFHLALGTEITPKTLLYELETGKKSFSQIFKNSPALQGILLGYGVNNSITYAQGLEIRNTLFNSISRSPPYADLPLPNSEAALIKELENNSTEQDKDWNSRFKTIQNLTCYKNGAKEKNLKIPFSFHPDTSETNKLLEKYRAAQHQVDLLLRNPSSLDEFFVLENCNQFEKSISYLELAPVIAQSILNNLDAKYLSNISSLIEGLLEAKTSPLSSTKEHWSKAQLLDGLLSNLRIDPVIKTNHLESLNFLSKIQNNPNIVCILPNYIYYKTKKNGNNTNRLSYFTKKVKGNILIRNINNISIYGNYALEDSILLEIEKMIPGFAHSLIGISPGEIRDIFIHPEYAYGLDSTYAEGKTLQITFECLELSDSSTNSHFPALLPVFSQRFFPEFKDPQELVLLEKDYLKFFGLRAGMFYKKDSIALLDAIISCLTTDPQPKHRALSNKEKEMLIELQFRCSGR